MAGFLTDYSNNKLLDLVFGSVAYEPPSTLYLGLSTTAANKSGKVSEPSGGGYARAAAVNNTSSFPAASGATKSNATAFEFPAPTANWGTVVSLFIADAPSGGNILASSDLTASRTINFGCQVLVSAGALFLSYS